MRLLNFPLHLKEKGFTVVEIVVALTILLLIVSSMVPLFVLVARTSQINRARTIALNLANKEVERVRNLSYDQVGTNPGNPSGVLVPSEEVRVGLFDLLIERKVKWVDSDFDQQDPDDTLPADYKKVTITVSSPERIFNTPVKLSTLVSRPGEETMVNRGNVRVNTLNANEEPVTGAQVDITAGPSAPLRDWTEENGEILFPALYPSLTENDYQASASKDGYVALETLPQSATVTIDNTTHLYFHLDIPGTLVVHLVDYEGNPVGESTITLSRANISPREYTSSDGHFNLDSLFPGDWEITAAAEGFEELPEPTAVQINSSETTETTITLTRASFGNLHLEVFEEGSGERLGPAQVRITNQVTGETSEEETNANGVLESVRLEYGTYLVEVSKTGFYSQSELVVIERPGNTFLEVYLRAEPTVGSVVIRVERSSGAPRNGIWVLVTGPSYSEAKRTGSYRPGEALFENLNPGEYRTYYWRGWWREERRVTVTAGNQVTVVYRY